MNSPGPGLPEKRRLWLERADQAAAAGVLLSALLALAGFWIWSAYVGRGVIDIDQAPPRTAEFKIDLNRADWPELAMLPNVGETLAHRIVEYRETNGPFRRLDDLRHVKGIGPKTYAEITPYLLPIEEQPAVANVGN